MDSTLFGDLGWEPYVDWFNSTRLLNEVKRIELKRNSRENNYKEAMTQTNDIEDNTKTALSDVSTQTDCIVDFSNAQRGEPDGRSSSDSTTSVKLVRSTDNESDNDSTTYAKEVYTTSLDCRQSYTKNWIDSLDVLIGSYLDSSRDDTCIDNMSQKSSASEVCIADQSSNKVEEHNNGSDTSNASVKTGLSFDSDDIFGD